MQIIAIEKQVSFFSGAIGIAVPFTIVWFIAPKELETKAFLIATWVAIFLLMLIARYKNKQGKERRFLSK